MRSLARIKKIVYNWSGSKTIWYKITLRLLPSCLQISTNQILGYQIVRIILTKISVGENDIKTEMGNYM